MNQLYKTKEELQALAQRLEPQIRESKKPFVIEFTGTPKSGKTTCVDAIAKFFRRNQISVHLVTERASVCPVRDKSDVFFNVWTGSMSLSKLIEALEHEASIIILDRGVFDSLIWMELHKDKQKISETEFDVIKNFFLLEKFRSVIDMVIVLSVEPEKALEREFKDQITDVSGKIMNTNTLEAYNECVDKCVKDYSADFRRLITIDTTTTEPLDGVTRIAQELLVAAEEILDEEVAVVPREVVQSLMSQASTLTEEGDVEKVHEALVENLSWSRRSIAEEDPFSVQVVSVAAIRRSDHDILICTNVGSEHGSMKNKDCAWLGGHTRKDDLPPRAQRKTVFRRSLRRELREELRLSLELEHIPIWPRAIIWDNTRERSVQHLALFYEYFLPARRGSQDLHQQVIEEHKDKSVFLRFMPVDEELFSLENLEPWTVAYLGAVHHLEVPNKLDVKQARIF